MVMYPESCKSAGGHHFECLHLRGHKHTAAGAKRFPSLCKVSFEQHGPGFFSKDATEPSEMESPMEGTTTLISAPLAKDTWKWRVAMIAEGKRPWSGKSLHTTTEAFDTRKP